MRSSISSGSSSKAPKAIEVRRQLEFTGAGGGIEQAGSGEKPTLHGEAGEVEDDLPAGDM
jgi:hypothetical protein